MNAATLIAVLSFAAHTTAIADLTEHEIEAWFHIVDTNDDHILTDAELDEAHDVFVYKCNLTERVTADQFFDLGDAEENGGNGDGFVSEEELDHDIQLFGEPIEEEETHSYFEILDKDGNGKIDREEMGAGFELMKVTCAGLTRISAKTFSELHCFDEEIHLAEFGNCLKIMEAESKRSSWW